MFFRRFIRAFKERQSKKAIVLCYHRIANPEADPWDLAVSKENFEEQLNVLQKRYNVISIPDLVDRLYSKSISGRTVCITFDDGYTDNYLHAKPLLEKRSLPATIFIPSKFVEERKPFWWDELEAICLNSPQLPAELTLNICGKNHRFINHGGTTLNEEQKNQHRNWKGKNVPPSKRAELYVEIWKHLRPLSYDDIRHVMEQLREWANFDVMSLHHEMFPMTKEQLKQMAGSPLFTIGMHTYAHPSLACHPYGVQKEEIETNRKNLKGVLGIDAKYLAYPYGSYNDDTLAIVTELNISAAFTTKRKLVSNDSSNSELGRYYVKNWPAKEFQAKLEYWFEK